MLIAENGQPQNPKQMEIQFEQILEVDYDDVIYSMPEAIVRTLKNEL